MGNVGAGKRRVNVLHALRHDGTEVLQRVIDHGIVIAPEIVTSKDPIDLRWHTLAATAVQGPEDMADDELPEQLPT